MVETVIKKSTVSWSPLFMFCDSSDVEYDGQSAIKVEEYDETYEVYSLEEETDEYWKFKTGVSKNFVIYKKN